MPEDKKDLFEELGVSRDATPEEIKKAYKRKAAQSHPDREGGDEETFKRVNKAYAVLSDDKKRSQYEHSGDGEAYVPTNYDQALQNLAVLFASLVKQNIKKIEYFDFIKAMNTSINANRREPKKNIGKLNVAIDQVERAMLRLKRKVDNGKIDLLMNILVQERGELERARSVAESLLEVMDIMQDIINNYDYAFKVDEHNPSQADTLKYLSGKLGGYKPGPSTSAGPSNRS